MRIKIHILLFLMSLLFTGKKVTATHMMGADMSYQCLGNGKYKIIAKVYRDCRGVSLSPVSFGAFAGTDGSNQCGSVSLSGLTRTGIRDITTRCSSSSNPCNPGNTYGTGKGVEEHTFEATIDFSTSPLSQFVGKSSCCEITFHINQCCRNGAITTGASNETFYSACMINICNIAKTDNKCNSSPQLSNEPVGFLCCNTPWYYNNGAVDTVDFDSISYKLVKGLSGLPATAVNYSSPFTERYFMTPFCIPPSATNIKCVPNINVKPPRGLYFDEDNGDIITTPTKCNEVPIMVIQQTEFRKDTTGKWVVVGRTRRDMQMWVIDECGFNKPPIIKGPFSWNICEGEKICKKIKIEDETFTPNQTIPDTVLATWNGGIPGATFEVVDPTKREKEYEFCWETKVGDASDVSYTFTVRATDQHCTPPMISIRAFKVKVNPVIVASIKTLQLTCSTFVFSPNINSKADTIKWDIFDFYSKKTIQYSKSENDTVTLSSGKYIIQLSANNRLCSTQVSDTLEVTSLSITTEPISKSSNINGQVQFNVLASDTTSSYQWQSNAADMGWSNLSNNSKYSGVSSKKLTVNNIKVKNHEQIFRVIATKNTCKDTSTIAMLTVNDTCITNVYDTIVTSTTDTLYIKVNTSRLSNPVYNTVKVYPNPSSTQVIIDNGNYSTMGSYNVKIINSIGQQVFQSVINQQQFILDAKTMGVAGVYTVYITDANNKVVGVKKIVLQ